MNNIKTIEVIKPVLGLNVGDTLTRKDANSNFIGGEDKVGEGYMVSTHLSVSPSTVEELAAFKVTEWFMSKKDYRDLLRKQEEKINATYTRTTYNCLDCVVADLKNELEYTKKELEYERNRANKHMEFIPAIKNTKARLNLIEKRIDTKINEFAMNLEKVNKVLELGLADDSFLPQVKESVVVFSNMVDLLKKLKA